MRFRFQMEETGGRPKRHPDSDGVDVYYCILIRMHHRLQPPLW
jgi:hypothetical protein